MRAIFQRRRRDDAAARFEAQVRPYLDVAYNLARYLAGNDQDAEDVVQEAMVRAFTFFASYRGGDFRAWLLTIVRNTAYTFLARKGAEPAIPFEESLHETADPAGSPEIALFERADRETLRSAIEALPVEFREALILREIEALDYKTIADITGTPMGTVMSRLARARKRLQADLIARDREECGHGL